jgi:hypothetical protein
MPTPTSPDTTDPAPASFWVFHTVVNGESVSRKPTAKRTIAEDVTSYDEALAIARAHRRSRWQHRDNPEDERVLSEAETIEAFVTDPDLFEWASRARQVAVVEYAVVIERHSLHAYEPRRRSPLRRLFRRRRT